MLIVYQFWAAPIFVPATKYVICNNNNNNNNNYNNNKYLMVTPLKGLFSIILKSPRLSQLRIPTGKREASWLFTKRGELAPSITVDNSIQLSESGI